MKHSIKRQMAGIFISVLAAAFLCVGLINAFFLKDYYMSEKKKAVVSAYEALNQGVSGGLTNNDDFKASMELICNTDNISIFVMDNSGEPKLATNRDYQILQKKLYILLQLEDLLEIKILVTIILKAFLNLWV